MKLHYYEIQRLERAGTTTGPVEEKWIGVKTDRPIKGKGDAVRYVRKHGMLGTFRVIMVLGRITAETAERVVREVNVSVGA